MDAKTTKWIDGGGLKKKGLIIIVSILVTTVFISANPLMYWIRIDSKGMVGAWNELSLNMKADRRADEYQAHI